MCIYRKSSWNVMCAYVHCLCPLQLFLYWHRCFTVVLQILRFSIKFQMLTSQCKAPLKDQSCHLSSITIFYSTNDTQSTIKPYTRHLLTRTLSQFGKYTVQFNAGANSNNGHSNFTTERYKTEFTTFFPCTVKNGWLWTSLFSTLVVSIPIGLAHKPNREYNTH